MDKFLLALKTAENDFQKTQKPNLYTTDVCF